MSAGSVAIAVTIVDTTLDRAAATSAYLNGLTIESASSALGRTVIQIGTAAITSAVVYSPSPPPSPSPLPSPPLSSPPPSSPNSPPVALGPSGSSPGDNLTDGDGDGGMSGGIVALIVILVLFFLSAGVAFVYNKTKGMQKDVVSRPTSVTRAGESSTNNSEPVELSSVNVESGGGVGSPRTLLAEDRIDRIESEDPEADHKAVKARLREYELNYEAREGRKPRKRAEWGEMWPEYERYAALRKMASQTKMTAGGSSSGLAEMSTSASAETNGGASLGESTPP